MTLHTPVTDSYIQNLWDGLMLIGAIYEYPNKRGELYALKQLDDSGQLLLDRIDAYYRGSGMRFHDMRDEIDKSIGAVEDIRPTLTRMWQKFKPLYEGYNKTVSYLKKPENSNRREDALLLICKDFGKSTAGKIADYINIADISHQLKMIDGYFTDLKALLPEREHNLKLKGKDNKVQPTNKIVKPFEEYLSCPCKEELIAKLEILLQNKKGRDVALIIIALLRKEYLEIPNMGRGSLYKAMNDKFGYIGSPQSINPYLSGSPGKTISEQEIAAMVDKLP